MNRDPQILCARSEIDSALNADTRILTVHFKMTALQNAAVNRSGRMNPVKIQARTECAALAQRQKARLALPAQAARQNASAAVHGIWQAQTGQQCARVVKPQTEIQSDLVCLIC